MPAEQSNFDFLVPYKKPLLRPDEAAKSIGRTIHHIYALIEEGKLEAHEVADRQKARKMITRRSVVLHLAETATYDPDHFISRAEALLDSLTADQLTSLIRKATQLRASL